MKEILFEWDEVKNLANIAKHKVNFANIRRVFDDPFRIISADKKYNYEETRWNCIGYVKDCLFFVVYTYRDETIRIISARQATPKERRIYGNS